MCSLVLLESVPIEMGKREKQTSATMIMKRRKPTYDITQTQLGCHGEILADSWFVLDVYTNIIWLYMCTFVFHHIYKCTEEGSPVSIPHKT